MEQAGLSGWATYDLLKSNAERDDINEHWTQGRRRELSISLIREIHKIGEALNLHLTNFGPRGYLPIPPRDNNLETVRPFMEAPQ